MCHHYTTWTNKQGWLLISIKKHMHTVLRIQIQLKPPQRRPTYGASHFVINLSWWEWVIPYTHMPNMFSCQNKSARCSVWIWCQTFSPDMTAPQVILSPSCSWFTQITFSSALHDCLSFSQSMQKCIKFFCRAAASLFMLLPHENQFAKIWNMHGFG